MDLTPDTPCAPARDCVRRSVWRWRSFPSEKDLEAALEGLEKGETAWRARRWDSERRRWRARSFASMDLSFSSSGSSGGCAAVREVGEGSVWEGGLEDYEEEGVSEMVRCEDGKEGGIP